MVKNYIFELRIKPWGGDSCSAYNAPSGTQHRAKPSVKIVCKYHCDINALTAFIQLLSTTKYHVTVQQIIEDQLNIQ